MSTVTDWLTTIFTGAYLVATILIYLMNKRSVNAMHDQLDESKKQYEETRRLQVMPFLYASIKECEYDDDEKATNPSGDFITYEDPVLNLPFYDEDNPDVLRVVKYLSLVNCGLGILHHTKISWSWVSYSRDQEKTFCDDIIIAPHDEWGMQIALYFSRKKENEDSSYSIIIKYEDLLGNKYKQVLELRTYITNNDPLEISIDAYSITSPKLIDEGEYSVN